MSREKKKKRSFLERAEENILEHIPKEYQKAIVGVYRFGFSMNIIGIIYAVFSLLLVIAYIFTPMEYSINDLIVAITVFTASLGVAILGACYTKMRLSPPLAFGWAIIVGLASLALASFFGFMTVASVLIHLDDVYSRASLLSIRAIFLGLTISPLVILFNAIYYLFFAHKKYTEWHEGYAKRRILNKKTSTVVIETKKELYDYGEDGL